VNNLPRVVVTQPPRPGRPEMELATSYRRAAAPSFRSSQMVAKWSVFICVCDSRYARRSRGDRGARADPTFSSTSNCSLIGGRAWRHLTALSLSLSLSAPRLSRRGIAITTIWIARLALTQTRDESEDGTSEPPGQRQGQGQTLLSLRYPPGPHL